MALTTHFSCKFYHMKPRKSAHKNRQKDLFKVELMQIIDPGHSLAKLAAVVDWDRLEEEFGSTFCPDNGRPAISTRLMVALHYLKYTHNLSDTDVVEAWVENPYWQHFSGMKYFEHKMPIHPSSMSRWRKRIGDAGAEQLLQETIEAGLKLKAVNLNFRKNTEKQRILHNEPDLLILQDNNELRRLHAKLPIYMDDIELIRTYKIFNNYKTNDNTYLYRINISKNQRTLLAQK